MRAITEKGKPFDHGVGWFRKPDDAQRTPAFVEHYGTGGGHWNAMRIYPEPCLALVAMTNTTYAWDADRLFHIAQGPAMELTTIRTFEDPPVGLTRYSPPQFLTGHPSKTYRGASATSW
jgi:hypothetical protein